MQEVMGSIPNHAIFICPQQIAEEVMTILLYCLWLNTPCCSTILPSVSSHGYTLSTTDNHPYLHVCMLLCTYGGPQLLTQELDEYIWTSHYLLQRVAIFVASITKSSISSPPSLPQNCWVTDPRVCRLMLNPSQYVNKLFSF